MNGLLFLVSIFSSFEVGNDAFISPVSSEVLNPAMVIEFAAAPHLSVGDPVFLKGQPIGSISSIEMNSEVKENTSIVKVKITDLTVPLSDNFIALVAKIKVKSNNEIGKSKLDQTAVRSAVELMQIADKRQKPVVSNQNIVHGFTSFEEFWNSTSRVSL
jgi:hypothetical protein